MKNYLLLSVLFLIGHVVSQNDNSKILGFYYGQLELMGTKHELLLHVSPEYKSNKPVNGKFVLEILNPEDSSSYPFKVNPVLIKSDKFEFGVKDLNAKYSGVPNSDFTKIEGTFEQSGMKASLSFGRSRFAFAKPKRPQTPEAPFSYHHREVKIAHIQEDFKLAGTLTLPADTTLPFPLVVMASGSGPQDRDEEILEHRLFLVLADYLAKNGIGSLRFDDRGVGQSGGVFSKASLKGFSQDVESVLEYLRKNTSFGSNPIGILGHSEGAMHAWMVSKRRTDVDFIISLAGPAIPGKEIIIQQQYDIAKLQSEEMAHWNKELFTGIIDILEKNKDKSAADKALTKYIKAHHKKASKQIQQENPLPILLQSIPAAFNSNWGREFIAWRPESYMPYYEGKVLYIIGDKDLQVHPELNFQGFWKYIIGKENLFTLLKMENLNHLLQTCNTCTLEEYGVLEETVAQSVLDEIVFFLKQIR